MSRPLKASHKLIFHQLLTGVLDEGESRRQKRCVIQETVDNFLDEYRRTLDGLPDFLTKIAVAETTKYKLENVILQIVYRPQLGYLVRIRAAPLDFAPPDDFEQAFVLKGDSYFKTTTMRELDEFLGDIKLSIQDIEAIVMMRVESKCLEFESSLFDVFDFVCQLDVLVGLSVSATQL